MLIIMEMISPCSEKKVNLHIIVEMSNINYSWN